MKRLIVALCLTLLAVQHAEAGSLCVAPLRVSPKVPGQTIGEMVGRMPPAADAASAPRGSLPACSATLCLAIDGKDAIPWPMQESQKLDNLALASRHRVSVFVNGERDQSFAFRFSAFKTKDLCLFMNDLYLTVQLSEAKDAPWCTCR